MNDPGPTSAGSINARLILDADEFERGMTRAGEQADRLDGRNVDVHIRTEGADRAEATLAALEVASNRYRIAELNLEQVMSRGSATEQQRLRAQNQLTLAGAALDRATRRRTEAVRAQTEAEHASTAATEANTAATEANTAAVQHSADAHKAQFSAMQVFIALSPAVLAAALPIAAAATGMAVAFGVMAGAGVAAIAGIKHEMQQGTSAGQQYAAGLATLKGDLSQLEQTGARAFLDSFNSSTEDINRAMPVLNQLIGEGARQLGTMGSTLLTSVIDGLERMQPLILAGAEGLQRFVGWLAGMTATDGFNQFVAYATANLPSVIGFLESVVTLAGRLLAAFAPLGPAVLGGIGFLVDVLSSMPLDRLAALTTMIVGLPMYLNIAKGAASLFAGQLAAMGIAANLAVPVIGILTAVLAGLTVGFLTSTAAQQAAIPSAMEYADALTRDGDAIGQYTKAVAEKKLADAGAYDDISKLGLGYDTLTAAVTGNVDAMKIIKDRVAEVDDAYKTAATNNRLAGTRMSQSMIDQKAAADALMPALEGNLKAIQQQQSSNEQLSVAQGKSAQADRDKAAAAIQVAALLGTTTSAVQAATDAQQKQADAAAATTLQYQLENNAAGLLKLALDGLNGTALSAAQAQNVFDSSLSNMGTHVDQVGKQIIFTTDSIGDMSAASVALRGQLNGQVSAAESTAEAYGQMQHSSEAGRQKLAELRDQIIDNAVAHGVDRDAVEQYIDKILQIPASVPPTKIDADTAAASAKLAAVQFQLDALHDKTINVTIATNNTGAGENAPGTSGGGLVHANALGGWAGTAASAVGYMALGGFARGTDTIPTMLTKGEYVVNRPAATSIERDHPGALGYINRTGQLPVQQGGAPAPVVYVQNPWTGEYMLAQFDARAGTIADSRIGAAARDAAYTRPGI